MNKIATIGIENIEEIKLTVLPWERRFDSQGDLALHPAVREAYLHQGYDLLPKSRQEADERGLPHFNGLMGSFTSIRVYPDGERKIVVADIASTRYLIGQAMRDLTKKYSYEPEQIQEMSPDMANVSLVAPVKIDSEYYLLSQIKGKALGSGQVHAGLVAGNVGAENLKHPDPLTVALKMECTEELGLNLQYLNSTAITFMIDERETGQVNFACVARALDLNLVLTAYEVSTKKKLGKQEPLEVMALANLPVAGLALTPLEKGEEGLKRIKCYKPTTGGLVESFEDRTVRPYTQAVIEYLSNQKNVAFLLEKAGF